MSDQRLDIPEIESVVERLTDDLGRFRSANLTMDITVQEIRATLGEFASLNEQFLAIESRMQAAIVLVSSLDLESLKRDLANVDQRILRLSSDLDVLRVSVAELRNIMDSNWKDLDSLSQRSDVHQREILSALASKHQGLEQLINSQQNKLEAILSNQDQAIQKQISRLQAENSQVRDHDFRLSVIISAALALLLALLIVIQ